MNADTLSVLVQLAGLLLAFLLGFRLSPKRLTAIMVLIGLSTNVVALLIISGGGEAAFAGFFVLPILCIILGHLGRGILWSWNRLRREPTR